MNSTLRNTLLAVFWVAWWLPFFLRLPKRRGEAVQKDNRARWGIIIQGLGFAAVYFHSPAIWKSPVGWWRLAPAIAIELAGLWLAWTAVAQLGRQWRVDAGLNADHELVRGGPYRLIRHPIYASMLCQLLMTAALLGTLPGVPVGIALFIIGTEIRVRVEDGLLAARFGEAFRVWQNSVPAYIPFVR